MKRPGRSLVARVQRASAPQELSKAQRVSLLLRVSSALDSMKRYACTDVDMNDIVCAANIASALAEIGLTDPDLDKLIADGLAALGKIGRRHHEIKRWYASPTEYLALLGLSDAYSAQLSSEDCTDALLGRAISLVREKIKAGEVDEVAA